MRITAMLTAVACLALTPAGALAQDQDIKAPNEGFKVAALGGVEGYTGSIAPLIEPGPTWGAVHSAQATPVLGIELLYSGATNDVSSIALPEAKVVRNGAGVNLRFALPTAVEPYVYGGVAVSRANVSGVTDETGYGDDTFGTVPVGGGVNFHAGAFNAGVRGGVDFPFDNDYLPENTNFTIWNGRLELGAVF
jgi:hypothetical protein